MEPKSHIFFVPTLSGQDPAEIHDWSRNLLLTCEAAESAGFEGVWLSEHHGYSYGGILPSPEVMLAQIATCTSSLRLGFAALILPFREPRRTLETLCMLDASSGGRVEVGLGKGFLSHEYRNYGILDEDKWQMFLNCHDQLRSGWQSGAIADAMGHAQPVLPRPWQQANFPGWITASRDKRAFEMAGRLNYGVMVNYYTRSDEEIRECLDWFHSARQAAGHPSDGYRVATIQHLFIGNHAQYLTEVQTHLQSYLNEVSSAIALSQSGGTGLSYSDTVRSRVDRMYEDLWENPKFSIGDFRWVTHQRRVLSDLGFTDILYLTHFGDLDWSIARQTIQRMTLPRATAVTDQ